MRPARFARVGAPRRAAGLTAAQDGGCTPSASTSQPGPQRSSPGIRLGVTLSEHGPSRLGDTVRAIADGHAAGATWSWLQSSASGYGVYEQLGFQTAENWTCWLSADTPAG